MDGTALLSPTERLRYKVRCKSVKEITTMISEIRDADHRHHQDANVYSSYFTNKTKR